ncbi:hypothetical protein EA772_15490 [Pedobacter sp. G11]|uniref:hypothetical protein n=1 Tax=Pedobacter sp. G11 TaxID=2482728 RepID=UPI000F5DC8D2|nr:hypothetical protein [Pedobacter sp. G11]AZI26677.1 hypothetical protein EA772_15490 [Pedobacter sp. G11]
MITTLIIALIAFVNSVAAYHLSEVSYKKISYYSAFFLLFIALGLGFKAYLEENNKPSLTVNSVTLPKDKDTNQYLLWLQLQNNGSSALQDVRASLFDLATTLEKVEARKESTVDTIKDDNLYLSPQKISIGTIPGNNGTEIYRTIIDGAKLQENRLFQIELNWNNSGMLYSFEMVQRKGTLELINPQVREKNNKNPLDPRDFYQFYNAGKTTGEDAMKEQNIDFIVK